MAVIKGDFRYFAYYESLEDLQNDMNVEERYLVTVITKQICTDYQISKDKGTNSIKLKNGLFANPIYSGNSLSPTISQIYSTMGPVENKVGGIVVGDEFQSITITELFNRMFYGSSLIDFDISDGLNKEVHVRGELHKISEIKVKVNRTTNKITLQEVYVNGELHKLFENEWYSGEFTLDVDISFTNTIEISVILRDEEGNAVEKKIVEETAYPIFYDVIVPDAEPNPFNIKRMENVRVYDDLSLMVDLDATSAFIAIPSNVSLVSVRDENNFNVLGIYTYYSTRISFGEDEVTYNCYKSRALTVDGFELTYSFKEV